MTGEERYEAEINMHDALRHAELRMPKGYGLHTDGNTSTGVHSVFLVDPKGETVATITVRL